MSQRNTSTSSGAGRTRLAGIVAIALVVAAPAAGVASANPVLVPNFLSGRLVYKPKLLPQGAHGAFEKLRWSHWGTTTATARGTFFYSDAYDDFHIPITVKLDRVRLCGGIQAFRRLRVAAIHANDQAKVRGFTPINIRCPAS